MKTVLLSGGFKGLLINYWNYVYGIILFLMVAFLVYWAAEILTLLKKDSRTGKEQLMLWGFACLFAFAVGYFLEDIASLVGIEIGDVTGN